MDTLWPEDIEEIKAAVARDFPNDPALQSVHVARKLLARGAELQGVSYLEHVRSIARTAPVASSGRQ